VSEYVCGMSFAFFGGSMNEKHAVIGRTYWTSRKGRIEVSQSNLKFYLVVNSKLEIIT
jgi:hypothetical protein